jgi:hypothetical protein
MFLSPFRFIKEQQDAESAILSIFHLYTNLTQFCVKGTFEISAIYLYLHLYLRQSTCL